MIYDVKPLENELEQELYTMRDKVTEQPKLYILATSDINRDDESYIKSIERVMKKYDVRVHKTDAYPKGSLVPFIKIGSKTDMNLEWLPPHLDVDAYTCQARGLAFSNNNHEIYHNSCTAEAIMTILHDIEERYFDNYKYQDVSVFGRGKVGLPTALLMTRDDRTVTVLHSKSSEGLFKYGLLSDVLIFATGHKDIVREDDIFSDTYVNPSVIIDAGINIDEDGKIVGDVNPEIYERAKDNPEIVVTPVPGGVGRITPLILVKHVLTAYK